MVTNKITTSTWTTARSALVVEATIAPVASIFGGGGGDELLLMRAVPSHGSAPGYRYLGCYTDYDTRILRVMVAFFNQLNNAVICCSWCANVR